MIFKYGQSSMKCAHLTFIKINHFYSLLYIVHNRDFVLFYTCTYIPYLGRACPQYPLSSSSLFFWTNPFLTFMACFQRTHLNFIML